MVSADPYQIESKEHCCIVSLLPALNDRVWEDIERYGSDIIRQMESEGCSRMVVDLGALHYMGSALVALLVRLWKWVGERNGRMVVVNHDETVNEVMEIAGLTRVWTIAETREEALKTLTSGSVRETVVKQTPVALTVTGIVVAATAALSFLIDREDVVPPQIALPLKFGGLAYGLIVGTVCAVQSRGAWRLVGLAVIAACLAIGLVGAFYL